MGKQFVSINLHNNSSDKYLHFCNMANDDPRNFLQLTSTFKHSLVPAVKITPRYFSS